MTAIQTPPKVQDTPRAAPDAAGTPTYDARIQAAVQAEQRTGATARWLWTRKTYYQAAEAGIFGPNERLELIEGEVIRKVSPQSDPHAYSVIQSAEIMRQIFRQGFHVREEKPMVLSDTTELEPDVAVVRGTLRQAHRHPRPENIALLIEVSVSTVKFDQTRKAELYARAGIADYWLLNMPARQLEVRRDPGLLDNGKVGYRSIQIIPADGQISPLAMPDVMVSVADMLPFVSANDTPEDGCLLRHRRSRRGLNAVD